MGNPSLSLGFTLFLSLSLSLSLSAISSTLPLKATPSDLFSQLGPVSNSSTIIADELNSCFKFLVNFIPPDSQLRYRENQSIWWPPKEVLELAQLAFDSGADPNAIWGALFPTLPKELDEYFQFLFNLIVARGPSVGLDVSLSNYDLFHGHLFVDNGTRRLGILFHAKEYPKIDELFQEDLGSNQIGSNVIYNESLMNLRNILWLAPLPSNSSESETPGVLVVLDAHPEGIIYRDLIPHGGYGKDIVRAIDEGDLGIPLVQIDYTYVGCPMCKYQISLSKQSGRSDGLLQATTTQ